jgi:hypothetical protein
MVCSVCDASNTTRSNLTGVSGVQVQYKHAQLRLAGHIMLQHVIAHLVMYVAGCTCRSFLGATTGWVWTLAGHQLAVSASGCCQQLLTVPAAHGRACVPVAGWVWTVAVLRRCVPTTWDVLTITPTTSTWQQGVLSMAEAAPFMHGHCGGTQSQTNKTHGSGFMMLVCHWLLDHVQPAESWQCLLDS